MGPGRSDAVADESNEEAIALIVTVSEENYLLFDHCGQTHWLQALPLHFDSEFSFDFLEWLWTFHLEHFKDMAHRVDEPQAEHHPRSSLQRISEILAGTAVRS